MLQDVSGAVLERALPSPRDPCKSNICAHKCHKNTKDTVGEVFLCAQGYSTSSLSSHIARRKQMAQLLGS